ncbi:hypothetical protein FNF27_03615 [Cafeteria roenbergensis]|uniref:Protein yippee-like n=1 Tax=Cafeteria roenbergensis TaxID=33653 RepID=A0A5A8EG14_CAFRO|nr:hypothetical protein FNF27_03615 [Cafeteria roenbergensis]
MGRTIRERVGTAKVYCCAVCGTHLARHGDIRSKTFHGRNGKAYLMANVRNVVLGEPENRILMTGLHTVVDAACAGCRSTIGWHYLHAYEPSESYKIGLFVLEKVWLARSDAWVAPVAGSHASDRRLVFRPRPAGVEGAAADDASGRAPLRGAVFV